jgi:hypothetical protein
MIQSPSLYNPRGSIVYDSANVKQMLATLGANNSIWSIILQPCPHTSVYVAHSPCKAEKLGMGPME